MTRILLSQATLDRLQPRLAGLADGLAIVTMGRMAGSASTGRRCLRRRRGRTGLFSATTSSWRGCWRPFSMR